MKTTPVLRRLEKAYGLGFGYSLPQGVAACDCEATPLENHRLGVKKDIDQWTEQPLYLTKEGLKKIEMLPVKRWSAFIKRAAMRTSKRKQMADVGEGPSKRRKYISS